MNKKTFHKKWYYRLLQVIFWGSLIPLLGALMFIGTLGIFGIGDDDIPVLAGFFWAGVIALAYWLAKRIFYYVMFEERIFPKKQQR